MAYEVSRLKSCKTLLLDANPAGGGQAASLGGALPDIVEGYLTRDTVNVVEIESAGQGFHAAAWPSTTICPSIPALSNLLRSIYDLIIVDCPPILKHPYLPDLSGGTRQVMLVVRSEVSSVREVQRAKKELAGLNASLWGAILTGQRPAVSRLFDKWF